MNIVQGIGTPEDYSGVEVKCETAKPRYEQSDVQLVWDSMLALESQLQHGLFKTKSGKGPITERLLRHATEYFKMVSNEDIPVEYYAIIKLLDPFYFRSVPAHQPKYLVQAIVYLEQRGVIIKDERSGMFTPRGI